MNPTLASAAKSQFQFDGEIEFFVEFPKVFDGETVFLSFTGETGVNPFYRSDPVAVEFLSGTVSGERVIEARGLPKDPSEEVAAAFQIDAEEVIDKPSYLHQSDVDRLLSHHGVASDQLNPILQCTLAILSILTERYGDQCRIVYWLHEA